MSSSQWNDPSPSSTSSSSGSSGPVTPGSLMGPGGTVGVPTPTYGHPELDGWSGARSLQWDGMPKGVRVVVSGGSFAVNTEELTSFASTLESAAQWLEDAKAHASTALAEARAAVAPPEPDTDWMNGPEPAPEPSYMPGFAEMPPYPLHVGTPLSPTRLGFEAVRTEAIDAISALTTGTGSLDYVAQNLRDLAADVTGAADEYGSAESAAGRDPVVDQVIMSTRIATLGITASMFSTVMFASVLTQVLGLDGTGSLPDTAADALQNLQVILSDTGVSTWVAGDLLLLAALTYLAVNGRSGTEASVIEQYLAGVSEDLDPWITSQLPDQVQVGSQLVATSSLTAMQRAAYYLATLSETNGAARYGERTGVTITPHGGRPITMPPGVKDPFGLRTPVQPMELKGVKAMPRPMTGTPDEQEQKDGEAGAISELIAYGGTVKPSESGAGAISILRTDHEDGTTSWMVVVPGTADWGLGSSNPQDQLTNLEAVGGRPTDMETAVVTAMRHVGIEPGQEVGIYGHSQGAMTALSVASDPAVASEFTITSVITAGGPTAGVTLPDGVSALHIENTRDAVPALDAAGTARTSSTTVVTVDTSRTDSTEYPHGQDEYAQAVSGISGDVDIDAWTEKIEGLTGAGEAEATTVEYVFDVTRETAGPEASAEPDD